MVDIPVIRKCAGRVTMCGVDEQRRSPRTWGNARSGNAGLVQDMQGSKEIGGCPRCAKLACWQGGFLAKLRLNIYMSIVSQVFFGIALADHEPASSTFF